MGTDLVKDPAVLHAAYNDSAGVTAAFNLNVLARANRELGGDFGLAGFVHSAFYNAPEHRIEMHFVSLRDQRVSIDGAVYSCWEGDTIETEISYKHTVAGFARLAAGAGWSAGPVWVGAERWFALHWRRPT